MNRSYSYLRKDKKTIVDIDLVTGGDEKQIKAAFTFEAVSKGLPPRVLCAVSHLTESHMPGLYTLTIEHYEKNTTYTIQVKRSNFLKKNIDGGYQYNDPLAADARSRDFAQNTAYINKDGHVLIPLSATLSALTEGVTIVIDKEEKPISAFEENSFNEDFKRAFRSMLQPSKGFALMPYTVGAINKTLKAINIKLARETKTAEEQKEKDTMARTINIFMQDKVFSRDNAYALLTEFDNHQALNHLYGYSPLTELKANFPTLVSSIISEIQLAHEIYAVLILLEKRNFATVLSLTRKTKDDIIILKAVFAAAMAENCLYRICFEDAVRTVKGTVILDKLIPLFLKYAYKIQAAFTISPKSHSQIRRRLKDKRILKDGALTAKLRVASTLGKLSRAFFKGKKDLVLDNTQAIMEDVALQASSTVLSVKGQ